MFNSNKMSARQEQLSQLRDYIKEVDKEVTMILQSLQWDRKLLLQNRPKITCKYDPNHKIPPDKLKEHEEKCILKSQGYNKNDNFLAEVWDTNSNTILKLTPENIKEIIDYASKTDPSFKKGDANVLSEPQTLGRLQVAYTADERRAIYDVVVNARPSCQQLCDLSLIGGSGSAAQSKEKSKLELMAQLRDLRRRRTKYRVAAPSRNYSNELRGVIEAQMEMYSEAQGHNKLKYRKDRKDQASKRVINTSADSVEREGEPCIEKTDHYGEHKRKRHYDDGSDSRKFDKSRYHAPTDERSEHNDRNGRSRKLPRTRAPYTHETGSRKHFNYDDESKTLERRKPYNYNNREDRDSYSSSSRGSQRYRDSEREERYKDRSRESHGNTRKNEHTRYHDHDQYRKQRY